MSTDSFSFDVYASEFCQMVAAVGLFQASPKHLPQHARVQCFLRHDGLTMAALNGASAAVGTIDTISAEGAGVFAIPFSQVKALLAIFDRPVPKDESSYAYVLSIRVEPTRIRVSDLSDHEELWIAVQPEDPEKEGGTPLEIAMSVAKSMTRAVRSREPLDLAGGVHFAAPEVKRLADAAKILSTELMLHAVGNRLLAPLSESFIAYTVARHRDRDDQRPPYLDARSVTMWQDRLGELTESGVF